MSKTLPLVNSQRRHPGRPAGEVYLAVLQAAQALRTERTCYQGATLRELVSRSCVGYTVARQMVSALKRRGHLAVVGSRKVANRNRLAYEYAPAKRADLFDASDAHALDSCIAGWAR